MQRAMVRPVRALAIATLAILALASTAVAAPFAYVVSGTTADRLAVIDTTTQVLLPATVATGGRNPRGVALTPRGDVLLVTNLYRASSPGGFGPGSMSIIETASYRILGTLDVGMGASGVAVSPDGRHAVVANTQEGTVSVVDVNARVVKATIPVAGTPVGVATSPDGQVAYVAAHALTFIALEGSPAAIATISFPQREMAGLGVAVNASGTIVYVAVDVGAGTGSVIALSTNTRSVIGTVTVGQYPKGIAVNGAGTRVYVANASSNTVSVIDTTSMAVIKDIPVGLFPLGIAVTPDGRFVYVANNGEASVSVIDAQANAVVNTITGGGSAFGEFIAPGVGHAMTQVVEFYHAARDHYFMTSDVQEANDLDSGTHVGWTRTGASFAAFASGQSIGLGSPVCRFYGLPAAGLDSHFYSVSSAECDAVAQPPFSSSWMKEGDNVFESPPPDFSSGECPVGTEPVFRLWNNRVDSNHRYTRSRVVKAEMIAKGHIPEGYGPDAVALCAPKAN
jgi:YVTN family beta-propeller protein